MNEIKVETTIHEDLQEVRYQLSKAISEGKVKKTGFNKHLGFYYLELPDYLPLVTILFYEHKLCPVFNIVTDPNTGIEIAMLDLYKGQQVLRFQIPTASVPNMTGVQELGAKDTYLRRYIYNNVLDIAIPDEVDPAIDENTKNAKVEEKKATPKQVEMIRGLYDEENIAKMIEYYGVNSLDELSLKQASEAIKRKTGK